MMRRFDIPEYYESSLLGALKNAAQPCPSGSNQNDPWLFDLGRLRLKLARHYGFCFGVQNAIEIAYRALAENSGHRIFLLSEMIHNPRVNADLESKGVRFLRSTSGEELIPFSALTPADVVVIPAFGAALDVLEKLSASGAAVRFYDATCPFVERVWKRIRQLGEKGYTIIVHGRESHEETRATFSRAAQNFPSLIIRDYEEAVKLADYLRAGRAEPVFNSFFSARCSPGFNAERDLKRLGVVNQTTMLASETLAISNLLKAVMSELYGVEQLEHHFADSGDTLCYATYRNQEAAGALIASGGDVALVVGGYKSSNTRHLLELCRNKLPAFFIQSAEEIIDLKTIRHFDHKLERVILTCPWLPHEREGPPEILLTAGASCPDSVVEQVISRIAELFGASARLEEALNSLER